MLRVAGCGSRVKNSKFETLAQIAPRRACLKKEIPKQLPLEVRS